MLLHEISLPLAVATVGGYVAGLAVSFELDTRWVFDSDTPRNAATMLRFGAIYVASGIGMA